MAARGGESVETTNSLPSRRDELVRRASAIARGARTRRGDLRLPRQLTRRIEADERRALSLACAAGGCEESRRVAALEFLAAVVTALALEQRLEPGDAQQLVAEAAGAIGLSPGAASLAVFVRALAATDAAQLPPQLAIEFFLDLVVELAPAEAVSLWTSPAPGRLECVAAAGEAARSRRLRAAARTLLEGRCRTVGDDASCVRTVSVERWDRPYGALVARGRPEASGRLAVYLAEAGAALSPLFEREMLYERNTDRERSLVATSERRLIRLGCDLHDGPMQEIVALAGDLRLARSQVASLLDGADGLRVGGRFDDLEARLASLDRSLRDVSYAVRSTRAVEHPLEHTLRSEVDALNRTSTIETELVVNGAVSILTASQKIALFRVVQESLSNARKHSHATRVGVRLRFARGYVSVAVSDNGCGFDLAQARRKGRLGLSGLIERVRLLGGDIEIQSAPGRGTEVRAMLPRWSRVDDSTTAVYAVTA